MQLKQPLFLASLVLGKPAPNLPPNQPSLALLGNQDAGLWPPCSAMDCDIFFVLHLPFNPPLYKTVSRNALSKLALFLETWMLQMTPDLPIFRLLKSPQIVYNLPPSNFIECFIS